MPRPTPVAACPDAVPGRSVVPSSFGWPAVHRCACPYRTRIPCSSVAVRLRTQLAGVSALTRRLVEQADARAETRHSAGPQRLDSERARPRVELKIKTSQELRKFFLSRFAFGPGSGVLPSRRAAVGSTGTATAYTQYRSGGSASAVRVGRAVRWPCVRV